MLAIRPPGRDNCTASSKVAGTPTASMVTSAPSPWVSERTTASMAAFFRKDSRRVPKW